MKRLITVIVLLIILVAGLFLWWQNGLLAANTNDKAAQIFVINKGEGVREVANNLKAAGLIRDPIVFFLYTRINNLDKQIQAGDFRINPSMSMTDVASNLTHGTLDIWTTIPEGLRADEIADLLKAKIPSYNESWRSVLEANEGYLFPDTYLIPRDADVNMIVAMMKNNFNAKYTSVKNTKTTDLTDAQTIVIASIIEREAIFAADRPLVASVFINRLNLGMALGSDPTVQYALGYQVDTKSWWKKDLTATDLLINSPYNTRKNAGLPPTPISNPGLSSIQAALAPAKTNYLYFFSDKQGHLHFASTIEGHNANIQKYGVN
ncbi:MAG TPA: endolytic transglycosylase MltG [Patescibacteria group bacterium]|jgi:UPF0755 protein|nr:endolytic transglycosylase MltG [Patescibacteria group bacterium]